MFSSSVQLFIKISVCSWPLKHWSYEGVISPKMACHRLPSRSFLLFVILAANIIPVTSAELRCAITPCAILQSRYDQYFTMAYQRNHTVWSASVNKLGWPCRAVALQLCRGRGSEKENSRCLTHCCPFSCSKEQLLAISCPWHFTHIHTQSQQEATTEAASLHSLIFTLNLIKQPYEVCNCLNCSNLSFSHLGHFHLWS